MSIYQFALLLQLCADHLGKLQFLLQEIRFDFLVLTRSVFEELQL